MPKKPGQRGYTNVRKGKTTKSAIKRGAAKRKTSRVLPQTGTRKSNKADNDKRTKHDKSGSGLWSRKDARPRVIGRPAVTEATDPAADCKIAV